MIAWRDREKRTERDREKERRVKNPPTHGTRKKPFEERISNWNVKYFPVICRIVSLCRIFGVFF